VTPFPLVIVVKATALLAASALVDAALRRRGSAAARHLVWTVAVVGLLALPIASVSLPAWTLRIPVAPRIASAIPAGEPVAIFGNDLALTNQGRVIGRNVNVTSGSRDSFARVGKVNDTPLPALTVAILGLYFAGALLLLARLAIEPIALRRLTRSARELTDPEWRYALDDASRELRSVRRVRLLQSAREIMPLTFGTQAPAIVLPASADRWTDDRRRAVLLHELAHIARRDCLVQRLTAVACALYWPHAGVWWAARRLRAERELACDDLVLASGAGAREYAGHLLDLAHSLGSAPAPATALGMARPKQLESRLLAVLDAARNRAAIRARGRTLAIVTAVLVLVPLAALDAALVARDASAITTTAASDPTPQTSAPTGQGLTGTWDLRLSRDPGMAQVTVRTDHGNHGRSIRLDQLPGISVDQISAASSVIKLPIEREAGTFNVDGVCRSGVCGGTFAFVPSQAFADDLARRGLGRPTAQQQMDLALADVGRGYLDALEKAGYAKPDLATVVRAAQHGVDSSYLREMTALGYRAGTLEALTQLRDHGVDPTYIKGMRDLGYRIDSTAELTRLRDHGVDPTYIRGMADSGFAKLSVDDLLKARDHGVDPSYMKGMRDLGYRLDDMESFVRMRDHGIDPEYVGGLASLGYSKLTLDQLLQARDHGVDPHFIREMADVGYKGLPLDALIRMRDHGVDAGYVRRVQQKGVGHLSVDELIERRDRGMDDPDAAARAVAAQVQSLWQSIVRWIRS
jgi:beta-lactamase regulating signal transducer with metallopeptidase domain